MDDCRSHVVVARRRAVGMLVLLENDRMRLPVDGHVGDECMRLGISSTLQNAAAVDEGEYLPGPIGADGFDRSCGRRQRRPDSALSRKRGKTPSSNTSRTIAPSLARFASN